MTNQIRINTRELDGLQMRKCLMAGAADTPVNILVTLASDTSAQVRLNVAQNASTPRLTLAMLANDKNLDVRIAVTKNAAVPYGLLFLLAADSSAAVRFAIAASEKNAVADPSFADARQPNRSGPASDKNTLSIRQS